MIMSYHCWTTDGFGFYMEQKISVDCGKYRLVAELYTANVPDLPPEIYVYLEDKQTGDQQNICMVRQHYELLRGETFSAKVFADLIDCLVWQDENKENYTFEEIIPVYDFAQDEDD